MAVKLIDKIPKWPLNSGHGVQASGASGESAVHFFSKRTLNGHWVLCCWRYLDEPALDALHRIPQQTRNADPILVYCWASVGDNGPTLNQYWSSAYEGSCVKSAVTAYFPSHPRRNNSSCKDLPLSDYNTTRPAELSLIL